jgi:hypothetical protein
MDKQSVEALDPLWPAASMNSFMKPTNSSRGMRGCHRCNTASHFAGSTVVERLAASCGIGIRASSFYERPSPAATHTRDATSTNSESRYATGIQTRPPCDWRARGCSSGDVSRQESILTKQAPTRKTDPPSVLAAIRRVDQPCRGIRQRGRGENHLP